MLNVKISKAVFDKLSEQEQQHYVQSGEDFMLDVKGDTPEMTRLRTSNSQLNTQVLEATNAKVQAEQIAAQADQAAEAKYKAQLEAATKSIADMREGAATAKRTELVNGIASKFNNSELFAGALQSRIVVEYNDKGEMVEKFLDDKGQPCTYEQLTDAYCKNSSYSAMLKAPPTTPTMPTNNQQQPQQSGHTHFSSGNTSGTQQPSFNQGGAPASNSAAWSIGADGKPVMHDYGKMSDADTRAYAEAKVAYMAKSGGATT